MISGPGFSGFSGSYATNNTFGGGYRYNDSSQVTDSNRRNSVDNKDHRKTEVDTSRALETTRRDRNKDEVTRADKDRRVETERTEQTRRGRKGDTRNDYDVRTDHGRGKGGVRDPVNFTVTGLSADAVLNAFRNNPNANVTINNKARYNNDIVVNYNTNLNVINNVSVTNNVNITNNLNETNNYDIVNNHDQVNEYSPGGLNTNEGASEAARALYLVTSDQFRQQLESSQNALNLLLLGRSASFGQPSFGTTF